MKPHRIPMLVIVALFSVGTAMGADPIQPPIAEAGGWFFSAGISVRTIHAGFQTGTGDSDLLNWRNFFEGRSGRGDPGLYSGGASPVVYDDGAVGPQNPDFPPGLAFGRVDAANQVSPHPLGEDNGFRNAVLAYHSDAFTYRTQTGLSKDDDETTGGPSVNWGYNLGEFQGIRVNLVSGWTMVSTRHTTGPQGVAKVFENHEQFTYLYDYLASAQAGSLLPGIIDGIEHAVIFDAELANPVYGGGYQSPRQSAETSLGVTPRFYAVSRADLDVTLNEIPFGVEVGRKLGPIDFYLTAGLSLNVISYELTHELAWYENRSDTPQFQKRWHDSANPLKAGLYGGVTAKLPLSPNGRVSLEGSTSYRWVDPVHASAGITEVEIDVSSWEGRLGLGIVLD